MILQQRDSSPTWGLAEIQYAVSVEYVRNDNFLEGFLTQSKQTEDETQDFAFEISSFIHIRLIKIVAKELAI
jgi:hypothetical protein